MDRPAAVCNRRAVPERLVLVCLDGGRLRERKAKLGKPPASPKRRVGQRLLSIVIAIPVAVLAGTDAAG